MGQNENEFEKEYEVPQGLRNENEFENEYEVPQGFRTRTSMRRSMRYHRGCGTRARAIGNLLHETEWASYRAMCGCI